MDSIRLFDLLERFSHLLRAELRGTRAPGNLQPIHWSALYYLHICNPYSNTPQGVTEYLGLTKGTVSQTLKVLEQQGFIEKHPDPKDRRSVHLMLTDAGKEVVNGQIPPPILREGVEGLNETQLQQTVAGLTALLRTIQEQHHFKTFDLCKSCRFNTKQTKGYLCGLTNEPLQDDETELICREHQPIEETAIAADEASVQIKEHSVNN